MGDREEFITESVINNVDTYFLHSLDKIRSKLTATQLMLIESMLTFIKPTEYSPSRGFELRRIRYEEDAIMIDYAEGNNPYLAGVVEAYEHVINILKDK